MGWLQAVCVLESGGAKSFDTQQLSLLSINFRDSLPFAHPLHHSGSCPTATAAWLHSSIHGEDASLLELSCGSKSIQWWWNSTITSLLLHAQDTRISMPDGTAHYKRAFFFLFLISNKVFPNKSPFIVMPLSSHDEVLKHLGPGHCLLNVTSPSAIAFHQYEFCLSIPRPALHSPLKIGLIYHHSSPSPQSLFLSFTSLAEMAWQSPLPCGLLILRKHKEDISRESVKCIS